VLERLNKGYTADDVAETVVAARRTRMAVMWVFMLGGPGETGNTVAQTFDFIQRHIGNNGLIFISCGLRVYPGTELARIAVEEGVIDSSQDLLGPAFYVSPKLGRTRLMQLISHADLPSGTVFLSDMEWQILPVLHRAGSLLHLTPPYWRHARPLMQLKRMFRL
jgi:radical SAM superfamily enzyme YgiQ (UPF0313 family)